VSGVVQGVSQGFPVLAQSPLDEASAGRGRGRNHEGSPFDLELLRWLPQATAAQARPEPAHETVGRFAVLLGGLPVSVSFDGAFAEALCSVALRDEPVGYRLARHHVTEADT
jgi:hypothetical protein